MNASQRYRPRHSRAEVLFTDGIWVPCTVLAWAKSQAGWAALVRWRNGAEEWLLYHPDHLQPALLRRAVVRSDQVSVVVVVKGTDRHLYPAHRASQAECLRAADQPYIYTSSGSR